MVVLAVPVLTIDQPTVPDSADSGAGNALSISVNVNNGGGATTAATTINFYRSDSDAFTLPNNRALLTDTVAVFTDGELPSGSTDDTEVIITPPVPTTRVAPYFYYACIRDDTDNTGASDICSAASTGLRVFQPVDMSAENLQNTAGDSSAAALDSGTTYTPRYTVDGDSNATVGGISGAARLVIYRSNAAPADSVLPAANTPACDSSNTAVLDPTPATLCLESELPNLDIINTGATAPFTDGIFVPHVTTAGSVYHYFLCVAVAAPLRDTDSANDCSTNTLAVTVGTRAAALTIPAPTGQTTDTLEFTVTNAGGVVLANTATFRVYRSRAPHTDQSALIVHNAAGQTAPLCSAVTDLNTQQLCIGDGSRDISITVQINPSGGTYNGMADLIAPPADGNNYLYFVCVVAPGNAACSPTGGAASTPEPDEFGNSATDTSPVPGTLTTPTEGSDTSIDGGIQTNADTDWFRFTPAASETYLFAVAPRGSSSLASPTLILHPATGADITSATGRITYEAPNVNVFYLEVTGGGSARGDYTLSARAASGVLLSLGALTSSVDSTIVGGADFDLSVTVTNEGDTAPTPPVLVDFYRNTSNSRFISISAFNRVGIVTITTLTTSDGTVPTFKATLTLAPDREVNRSGRFFFACIRSRSDENRPNTQDLALCTPTLSVPRELVPQFVFVNLFGVANNVAEGGTLTATVRATNLGTEDATPVTANIYAIREVDEGTIPTLPEDTNGLISGMTAVGTGPIAGAGRGGVGIGDNNNGGGTITITAPTTAGTYYLYACVRTPTSTGFQGTCGEDFLRRLTVTPPPPPSLTITTGALDGGVGVPGQTVTGNDVLAPVRIENTGSETDATLEIHVRRQFDGTAAPTNTNARVNIRRAGESSTSQTIPITIPAGSPGVVSEMVSFGSPNTEANYYVFACVRYTPQSGPQSGSEQLECSSNSSLGVGSP